MKNYHIQKKHILFVNVFFHLLYLKKLYLSLNTSTLPLNSTLRIGPRPIKR